MSKLLITGFGPFDGPLNASQVLVESLAGDPPPALAALAGRLALHVFTCDRATLQAQLEAVLERERPTLCLFLGQARGSSRLGLERLATNLLDFSRPDAAGHQPRGERIDPRGPAAYWSTLPRSDELIAAWQAAGISAGFSNHAGNHLCNQLLYLALHRAAASDGAPRCGFLHLPLLPEQSRGRRDDSARMPLAMSRTASVIALQVLIGGAGRQPPG